jgi:hypothetical protein
VHDFVVERFRSVSSVTTNDDTSFAINVAFEHPRNDALGCATNRVAIHPGRSSHQRTSKSGRSKGEWGGEPTLELSFVVAI